jgi:hypothetical protein
MQLRLAVVGLVILLLVALVLTAEILFLAQLHLMVAVVAEL